VLVQGAGGGLATAAIALGAAAGLRVWTTSRDEDKRDRAVALGADQAFESGARLPERVDCVIESVGRATWEHSLKSLRPGGRLVVTGSTSGHEAVSDLRRVFFLQLDILGSTMGTRDELDDMLAFMAARDVRPIIDRTLPLADTREGLAAMAAGELFGKIVVEP
jgi:NADPH:quinone reductase-like Zn-dependent oxidoreductase